MSDEKLMNVVFHDFDAQEEFYEQMETEGKTDENKFVPERKVELFERRAKRKQTSYYLTVPEAEKLFEDPRVEGISSLEPNPNVRIVPDYKFPGTQSFDRTCTQTNLSNVVDWAKLSTVRSEWPSGTSEYPTDLPGGYYSIGQWEGQNVNVFICDGHIKPDHPEFAVNLDGTGGSRVNQYDWFKDSTHVLFSQRTYNYGQAVDASSGALLTEEDDHGHHVAGTAAGNRNGWASKSTIYNLSPYSSNPNWIYVSQPLSFLIDSLTDNAGSGWWWTHGGGNDPIVINCSFSFLIFQDLPMTVWYRGSQVICNTTADCAEVGIDSKYDDATETTRPYLYMFDYGYRDDINWLLNSAPVPITIVASGGNGNVPVVRQYRPDGTADPDYMNWFEGWEGQNLLGQSFEPHKYYARGGTNNHRGDNISVGATTFQTIYSGNTSIFYSDIKATYSNKGSAIDIYAPGSCIVSSTYYSGYDVDDRYMIEILMESGDQLVTQSDERIISEDGLVTETHYFQRYGGTSMSAPQVAGMAAVILSRYRHLNCSQVLKYLQSNAKDGGVTALDPDTTPSDYLNLWSANNKLMKFKSYGGKTGIVYPKSNNLYRSYPLGATQQSAVGTDYQSSGLKFPRTQFQRPHLL